MQQDVVETIATHSCSLHKYGEILHHRILSSERTETNRAKSLLYLFVGNGATTLFSYIKYIFHTRHKVTLFAPITDIFYPSVVHHVKISMPL